MHIANDSTPCIICGANAVPFVTLGERPTVICEQCRHIAWHDMPTMDELKAYYTAAYARDHNQQAIQSSAREYYRQHAIELVGKGQRNSDLTLLDYGCAWPVMLEEAKSVDAYSRLIGVEYDDAARTHGTSVGLEMHSPDGLVDALGEASVDILRFSHVVEHMNDPITTLRELALLLKPGGLIYLTQPIFPTLRTDARPETIKDAVYPEHLHFFTTASLNIAIQAMSADIFELAAFQKQDEVAAAFVGVIDSDYAATINKPLLGLTPAAFQGRGGYPDFIGENVFLYARKRRALPSAQLWNSDGRESSSRSLLTRIFGRRRRSAISSFASLAMVAGNIELK